jgi:glycosyltransferase involved in cell wall biosynthesis
MKKGLSVVIIAMNEERSIGACIRSVIWADEIILVDSGSTDKTTAIARKLGAKIIKNDWQSYAKQKNVGIKKAAYKWILSMDADETLEPGAEQEIKNVMKIKDPAEGYSFARRNIYYTGKWLRHGGLYPDLQLRLIMNGMGKFDEVLVHESLKVSGRTGRLNSNIIHYTKEGIAEHIATVNRYTELEAQRAFEAGRMPTGYSVLIKPLSSFLKHYLLTGGFRDGMEGFIYHVISAYYIFIKEVKTAELIGFEKVRLMSTIFKRSR